MSPLDTTVCVVGAGPAGLVVAHRMQQAGVACLVLERQTAQGVCARAKAGMIEYRVVQALRPWGLAAPIVESGSTNGVLEVRLEGQPHVVDYAALTGGKGHYVYSQHLLVRDWLHLFAQQGGLVRYGCEFLGYEGTGEVGSPLQVRVRSAEGARSIRCQSLVLASGASCAPPAGFCTEHEHAHPFRWLTIMLEAPPLGERTIYAPHSRGFAAHLRRSAELTRYYLQVPAEDRIADWPRERVLRELGIRLGVDDSERFAGPIVEQDVLDLRVRVREPMQRGGVHLAGDAAHLITPAGGKGMNLAIDDGLELSEGLVQWHVHGKPQRLAQYSERRLAAVWRTQEFSNWMLMLFCGGPLGFQRSGAEEGSSFAQAVHRAQVQRLFLDERFARWFAHRYAGVHVDP